MAACRAVDGIDERLGGEVKRVEHFSSEEYTTTLRFYPNLDLKISENVDIDFFVSPALRESGGVRVFLTDERVIRYFPPEYIASDDGKTMLSLPWMVKVRYSIPVWYFAVRSLLRLDGIESWRASVLAESEFRNFTDTAGSGISSGRNQSGKGSAPQEGVSNVSLVFGKACNRGRRPYMEDVDVIEELVPVDSRAVSIFGVLDGHGGQDCAVFVKEEFPSKLVKLLRSGHTCAEALFRAFQEVDEEYIRHTYDSNAGSTANLALFDKYSRRLFVANTGDTRAVLSRNGKAMDLSFDRKASDAEEIARIVLAGGYVINNRVLGSLAVSRAFGDIPLKSNRNVLLVDPEITSLDLSRSASHINNFIVIATDGLWDVMSSQSVVDFVRDRLCAEAILAFDSPHPCQLALSALTPRSRQDLQRKLENIANDLVTKAIQELNSMDNVTVLLVVILADEVNSIANKFIGEKFLCGQSPIS